MLARLLMTLDACLALISNSPAIALTRAPLVMAFVPELAFMAFIVFGGNMGGSPGTVRQSERLLEGV